MLISGLGPFLDREILSFDAPQERSKLGWLHEVTGPTVGRPIFS